MSSSRNSVVRLVTRCSWATNHQLAVCQQTVLVSSWLKNANRKLHTNNIRPTIAATTLKTEEVKPFEDIPGPKSFPIVGIGWNFLPYIGEFHGMGAMDMHRFIYKKYGPIARFEGFLGRPPMVFVFQPEDMEVTYRNEGPWPIRSGMQSMQYYRNVTRKDFYKSSCGVLVENGAKWAESRSKVNPPMMQPRISKQYIQPIGGVAQDFVERIRNIRDQKDELPPDFINELFKWSLESIAYVALDVRLGCLEPSLTPESEPQKMINAVADFFDCLFTLEIGVSLWKIFPTPTWKRFARALDVFLEVSVKYVNAAIERNEKHKAGGGGRENDMSVLERLLTRMDAREATIMAQDMLFGGVDTTSYTIAAALCQMSKNQDKQELLFGELKQFLPNKNDPITEDKLEDMKYLKACLKESFRLVPTVPGNLRATVKEIIVSNYKVPKGTNIVMPSTISFASEEIFPQSKRYIPERWLKVSPKEGTAGSKEDFDAVTSSKRHPFVFLPFGFGSRSCVGKRFADLETEILLAKIVRNFKIEYNYGEITFVSKILTMPKEPLRFKITERES